MRVWLLVVLAGCGRIGFDDVDAPAFVPHDEDGTHSGSRLKAAPTIRSAMRRSPATT